ncbi:PREDICTED: uncharacterized protein LOC105364105 [Ceratosolen solmsi marchali]|uniref:Uncharacterized protein LOC105364105 n=1 Tax=Ceratosolen solmsi marchali TaxID=326594 RepID=A0AAJ6YLK2_9HYME|nr:PREDICTED: uncharacterized protein LOC105364105 [Ceratosolen solmsi marchali]
MLHKKRRRRRRKINTGKKQREDERERKKERHKHYNGSNNSVQERGLITKESEITDESPLRRRRKRRSNNNINYYRMANKSVIDNHQQHDQSKQSFSENPSSESELLSDAIDHNRSLTFRIRFNPIDFEYFTSVVHSEDERLKVWQFSKFCGYDRSNCGYEFVEMSRNLNSTWKSAWEDTIDERMKAVMDCNVSQFELSLLLIQLLLALQEHATSRESNIAMPVLKVALDTLWTLQFSNESIAFSVLECATLKAATARLMLSGLERVLQADEPITVIIHNGLLPMTLRLLEDACTKPIANSMTKEEGSLLQELIFATTHAVITFLYFLLHQRGSAEKFKDFRELFQLFIESQEGKLVERIILVLIELPNNDSNKSIDRASKVIDMIGALICTLKRMKQDLSQANHCRRHKHKTCIGQDEATYSHHHLDILGSPYFSEPAHLVTARASLSKPVCSISSLFSTLTSLLKETPTFNSELQIRLIKVMTTAGTCCCFPPKYLLASIITFLKKGNGRAYCFATALIERTIFKELGGYSRTHETCNSCSALNIYSWDFLDFYVELLNPEDKKLCHIIIRHLLKVVPNSTAAVKQELLFRVFYPLFIKAKASFERTNTEFMTIKFLIQSCLSAITSLIVNPIMFQKFIELDGLDKVLNLLPNQAFVKSVYALLEISVIMEIKGIEFNEGNKEKSTNSKRPAATALFHFLEQETIALLSILRYLPDNGENCQGNEEGLKQRAAFHQASGVWRATAGVLLCSPKFRTELKNNPIFDNSINLAESLAIAIATDRFNGGNKFALRVMEAVVTCCLVASISSKRKNLSPINIMSIIAI